MLPLESVPNFSEGRDRATIDAIGDALAAHARLLDVHADADHNRSVFTLVGSEDELADALVAGVARRRRAHRPAPSTTARIRGIGAADVVPIVPLRPADLERARRAAARRSARGIGASSGYRCSCTRRPARGPAFYRRGGRGELQRRLDGR